MADTTALLDEVAPPTMAVRSSAVADEVAVAFCTLDVLVVSTIPEGSFDVTSLGIGDTEMEDSCAVAPQAKIDKDMRKVIGGTIRTRCE